MLGDLSRFLTADGTFVFTLTSNGYKYLTLNLVHHLRALRLPWTLCVICADVAAYRFFTTEGVPCICPPTPERLPDYGPQVVRYGFQQFQRLNKKKLDLLAEFVQRPEIRLGIYLDGDIVIYRDPVPDIASRFAAAPGGPGLLMQCDEPTRVDCSGAGPGAPRCPNLCTGVLAWRGGTGLAPLFEIRGEAQKGIWQQRPEDQAYVNRRIEDLGVSVGVLPRTLYPNGKFCKEAKEWAEKPILLHYNYLVGGDKRRRMIQNGDWLGAENWG